MDAARLAIIGAGNLGQAIARGLVMSERYQASDITLTRRSEKSLVGLSEAGFTTTTDNTEAIQGCQSVLIAVRPAQIDAVLETLAGHLDAATQVVVSTVSDVTLSNIRARIGSQVPVVRAMPNIGVQVTTSMTCLSCEPSVPQDVKDRIYKLFGHLGHVEYIEEEQMTPATALCACGVAFFLRAIRAASQGGVEVGFHADEAIRLAAQTAKGAAELILRSGNHPESLIDAVTTPLGVTIAGLNEMEHHGLSSAMIRGIVTSAQRASGLYSATERS